MAAALPPCVLADHAKHGTLTYQVHRACNGQVPESVLSCCMCPVCVPAGGDRAQVLLAGGLSLDCLPTSLLPLPASTSRSSAADSLPRAAMLSRATACRCGKQRRHEGCCQAGAPLGVVPSHHSFEHDVRAWNAIHDYYSTILLSRGDLCATTTHHDRERELPGRCYLPAATAAVTSALAAQLLPFAAAPFP